MTMARRSNIAGRQLRNSSIHCLATRGRRQRWVDGSICREEVHRIVRETEWLQVGITLIRQLSIHICPILYPLQV